MIPDSIMLHRGDHPEVGPRAGQPTARLNPGQLHLEHGAILLEVLLRVLDDVVKQLAGAAAAQVFLHRLVRLLLLDLVHVLL